MKRPILNVEELTFDEHSHGAAFAARVGPISKVLGAEKLGARVVVLEPGKKAWPFHNHHGNEEMFVILQGQGTLRYGSERFPLRSGDVVMTPAGGTDTAHQILNSSTAELRYLAVSTMAEPDVVEYPDSKKFAAIAGSPPGGDLTRRRFSTMATTESTLGYWDGEEE